MGLGRGGDKPVHHVVNLETRKSAIRHIIFRSTLSWRCSRVRDRPHFNGSLRRKLIGEKSGKAEGDATTAEIIADISIVGSRISVLSARIRDSMMCEGPPAVRAWKYEDGHGTREVSSYTGKYIKPNFSLLLVNVPTYLNIELPRQLLCSDISWTLQQQQYDPTKVLSEQDATPPS
jgi:hypothetical protein